MLFHDYSRIPSQAVQMIPGRSIEAQWMCMEEARRESDMQREGISNYRQGNFHQPRCLMYLMKTLERMLDRKG